MKQVSIRIFLCIFFLADSICLYARESFNLFKKNNFDFENKDIFSETIPEHETVYNTKGLTVEESYSRLYRSHSDGKYIINLIFSTVNEKKLSGKTDPTRNSNFKQSEMESDL